MALAQVSRAEQVFSGKLGNEYRIQMRLRREGGTLSGVYFYERGQDLNRDVTLLTELLKLSSAETCRALDMETEMFSMGQQQFFSSLFASEGWQVDALDESALVFEPVAGGRLLRVKRAGGQPALTGKTSDAALTFGFMVGRAGGQWQVLSALG